MGEILVVKRKDIFGNQDEYHFQGYRPADEFDYESLLLRKCFYIERNEAENDPRYKQPIGYIMIVNPRLRKVFAFQRAKGRTYSEKRLRGNWAWAVGGHIETHDKEFPVASSIVREVSEEVLCKKPFSVPQLLGYINDDGNSVGRVHFGMLFVVKTNGLVFRKGEEHVRGSLKSLYEITDLMGKYNIDNWSVIALNPLKDIIGVQ